MKVIIIGAGPSGVAAAINAKKDDNEVLILEKNNKVLKKLLLTGAGRCNYFNDNFSEEFYNENNFLVKKVVSFKNDYLKFLKRLGLEHFVQNGYYYPYSKSSVSVQNSLVLKLQEKGIEVIYDKEVYSIKKDGNGYLVNSEYYADKLIVSAGSKAYPNTGSSGEMYDILNNLGILINPILPSLVQLKTSDKIANKWPLLRVSARVSLYIDDELVKIKDGELQLTNYGISGICTLSLSDAAVKSVSLGKKTIVKINFLPNITDYNAFINERIDILKERNVVEFFEGLINYKLLKELFKYKKIDENKLYKDLFEKEKEDIRKLLTEYSINIDGYNSFSEGQICQGGVLINELTENFELKKYPGMYVIGEIVDIHGDCGGYNLAYAFISGLIAGLDAKND